MTTEKFIEQLVKIDELEQFDAYGHYPFQLFVETADGKLEMNALALGGDVGACYNRVKKYKDEGAKKIFLSLDFPAGGDIEHDFVCVFSIIDGETSILAIPYNTEDGTKFETIHNSSQFEIILQDFNHVLNNQPYR